MSVLGINGGVWWMSDGVSVGKLIRSQDLG